MMFPYSQSINLVCGHYGCGKTTFSLNLAQQLTWLGQPVYLADLDIVNPYFRSSDYTAQMKVKGIHCINPQFAGSNLESPSLNAEIDQIFENQPSCSVIDLGGDCVGATVFGRYASRLSSKEYACFYLVNYYRGLSLEETLQSLREIEASLRLSVTAIVNNSNLGEETTLEQLVSSQPFVEHLCHSAKLPLAATCCAQSLLDQYKNRPLSSLQLFPLELIVKKPWETALFPI